MTSTIEPVDTKREDKLVAFANRLNEALDAIGFPAKGRGRQVELARLMDVSQKGARKWLEGEGLPTTDKQIALAALCRRSFEWLATGHENQAALAPLTGHAEGSISHPPPTDRSGQHQQQEAPPLTAEEQVLLDAYRLLEPADREGLVAPLLEKAAFARRYIVKAQTQQQSSPDQPAPSATSKE